MEHPFINDLSEQTMEELQDKITDLNKKLNFAYKTGNSALIHQIQMVIESYKNQHRKKMDELFEKQKLNNQINIQS